MLELVVLLSTSTFSLFLMLHLTPVVELGKSDLSVDPFLEYFQLKELVLGMCVPELHRAQMGVGSILDVLMRKILGRRMVKNELSLMVVHLIMWMEEAIMLEGILFLNALHVFLLHCLVVMGQALLKLLEVDAVELK
jgi:hypothetical protein